MTRPRRMVIVPLLLAAMGVTLAASELRPQTLAAYNAYIARLDAQLEPRVDGEPFLTIGTSPGRLRQVRDGKVIVLPGHEDGIINIPDGLVHHWMGAMFIPGVTRADVLAVAQDYDDHERMHEYVIDSRLLERHGDTFRVFMRLKKSTSMVTVVLDTWSVARYEYPSPARAVGKSDTELIREVKDAGTPGERLLTPGQDSGYLWRANIYTRMLERDGGVYIEIENLGLSRRFPFFLGWLIEPIARSVGRSSVEDTLKDMRRAINGRLKAGASPPAGDGGVMVRIERGSDPGQTRAGLMARAPRPEPATTTEARVSNDSRPTVTRLTFERER